MLVSGVCDVCLWTGRASRFGKFSLRDVAVAFLFRILIGSVRQEEPLPKGVTTWHHACPGVF